MIFLSFFKGKKRDFTISLDNLTLKPFDKKNIPVVKKWFNDRELIKYAFGVEAEDKVLKRIGKNFINTTLRTSAEILEIWVDKDLIGIISYTIFKYQAIARIGILIGEEKYRSKGYGTKALNLALLYLFDREGVDKVELDTAVFNKRGKRCFEKCGFHTIGKILDTNFPSKKPVEKYKMVLTRDMFFKDLYLKFKTMPKFEGNLPDSLFLEGNSMHP